MYIVTSNQEYRGLEGTGIYIWSEEHSHHLARLAAEIGDVEIETACDQVIAGEVPEDALINLVEEDERYRQWMERGFNLGWECRRGPSASTTSPTE